MTKETAEGSAAFALTQAILTLLIRGRAMTPQGAGVLVIEAVALLKGADKEDARQILLELAGKYGAKAEKARRKRRG